MATQVQELFLLDSCILRQALTSVSYLSRVQSYQVGIAEDLRKASWAAQKVSPLHELPVQDSVTNF